MAAGGQAATQDFLVPALTFGEKLETAVGQLVMVAATETMGLY